MVNLEAFIDSMKITWIRRLIISPGKWSKLVQEILDINGILKFGEAYTEIQIQEKTNRFWNDVLGHIKRMLKRNCPLSREEVLATPVFYNNLFKIGGNPIYFKHWCDKGVFLICDLIKENGIL